MADSVAWFHSNGRKSGDGFLWKVSECLMHATFRSPGGDDIIVDTTRGHSGRHVGRLRRRKSRKDGLVGSR